MNANSSDRSSQPPPESAGQELSDAEIDSMLCEINKWCAEYPLDADVGLPLLDATASDELRAIVRDAILAANRTANHE